MSWFPGLWRDENGATAIEYAMIAGMVSIAIVIALTALGGNVGNLYNSISNAVGSSL